MPVIWNNNGKTRFILSMQAEPRGEIVQSILVTYWDWKPVSLKLSIKSVWRISIISNRVSLQHRLPHQQALIVVLTNSQSEKATGPRGYGKNSLPDPPSTKLGIAF